VSFLALAAYVGVESVRSLLGDAEPDSSPVGIGLAVASLAVMPLLSFAQRRTGRALGSNAVVADGTQTLLCTYLSGVLLLGLVLNATLGWSWADPFAGLVIAAVARFLGRSGSISMRSFHTLSGIGMLTSCCMAPTDIAEGHTSRPYAHAHREARGQPWPLAVTPWPCGVRRPGGSPLTQEITMAATITRRLVSLADAADALSVSTRTVRRYIADGQLEAVRLGRKTLRIKVHSIERFIDAWPAGNWRGAA
jgi:excisionase family DNA binding protein